MQNKPKILLVDDRPANLLALEHTLAGMDVELLKATSGNEALKLMIHHDFALVLLDVQMPGMDGFEVAALMRDREATKNIPIIFVTAIDSAGSYASKGYDAGAVDYLYKPVDASMLKSKVSVFLRMYRQRKELEKEVIARKQVEALLREAKTLAEEQTALAEQQTALANSMAAEAEMGSQSKSEFLANMSHDIRTPMTAILGFAETLLEPHLTDAEKIGAIHTIRRNGNHLLQIINDILDISKIEAGKLEIEHIRCSPVQLVAELKALMQVRADAKKLPFNIEYIGAIPETINSDPTRLKQILLNLIGNAIKFTEEGAVRLITRLANVSDDDRGESPQESKIQFDVLDTGLGMTKEQMGHLFQAFSQADTSTTRKFGGSGLGLMISKRLAEKLDGTIIVESEPGEGSLFRLTVSTGSLDGVKMLDDPIAATIVQPDAGAAVTGDDARLDCRILLAEDGADNQRLIGHVLTKAGAEVTMVENGKLAVDAALAALNRRRDGDPERRFDVVLMDMQMPVMDGYEATGLPREKGYTGPIIALTAHAMASDRQKCIAAGCDDYATKPINRKKLIDTICQNLRHRTRVTVIRQDTSEALISDLADNRDMLAPVETFVGELPERMAAIEKALAGQDIADLAKLVHEIKRAAGGHGFPAISEMAEALESSAKGECNLDELKLLVDALSALCERTEPGDAIG